MTDFTQSQLPDRENIPSRLLQAMMALALSSLALVTFAVVTDRDHVGQPKDAAVLAKRTLVLKGHGAKAVTVTDADGKVLFDLEHGGFVTVIQNGLERTRTVAHVDQTLPVQLVQYANGRLTVFDPATGWSVELGNFGKDNKAAFERLLTK
jgi:putative photosynthetic complex assembly protein